MIFAAIIDAGLIPFYVLAAIMSRNQYTYRDQKQGHWQTLLSSDGANYKIIFSTFLASVVDGSLHLMSLLISFYLAVIFRQISSLPPDMNPLEDNLTSRHKRNKSSIQTTTTTTTTDRNSKAEDALMAPPRTVPFLHTRTDSLSNLAHIPHPQTSPRSSRLDNNFTLYDQPPSKRSSQANFSTPPTRPGSSIYSEAFNAEPIDPPSTNYSRSVSPPLDSGSENWTAHSPPPPSPFEFKHLRSKPYQPVPQSIPFDADEKLIPHPLEMNPPTPPNNHAPRREKVRNLRPLVPGAGNTLGAADARSQRRGLRSGKVRVVSSGVEVETGEGTGKGVRAREVSGKVAEEGRGDRMWRERRVGGKT